MALRLDLSVCIDDGTLAQALIPVEHVDVGVDTPPLVLVFLAEEFDAFVDFNVLLATNVRGLKLVLFHMIELKFYPFFSVAYLSVCR